MGIPYAEVIGDPVAHSKSPLIHKFWLERLGLEADYRAVRVTPEELAPYLASRRADPDWRGCSVTMPHKERILPLLDRLDEQGLGAVNCVLPQSGGLVGLNTDRAGVASALADFYRRGVRIVPPACVIGAGGAARATLAVLADIPIRRIHLVVRDVVKGKALLRGFPVEARAFGFDEAEAALAGCVLLGNASPLGMAGAPPMPEPVLDAVATLHRDASVFDMVYDPLWTALLARARAAGLDTIDGLEMLAGQAEQAFVRFFGVAAPPGCWPELRELVAR